MKNTVNIELLDRFMRGDISVEEEQRLLAWFRSKDAHAEILDFYKGRWQDTRNEPEADYEIQERMYQHIKMRMQAVAPEKPKKKETTYSLYRWMRYAAVLILLIAVGAGSHFYTRQSQESFSEYKVEASKGQRANVTLPDGTKVWLNSHSSLIYKANYGVKDRMVSLSGEAFFEVAKDQERRFVVDADGMQVEALGTSFNVKSYKEDRAITATLLTGSVKITSESESAVLTKGQQACFNKNNGRLAVAHSEMAEYANMWRDNELVINAQTLSEIAVTLNRMYNVEVRFESEKIKEYRFSGVIRNNSLDNVIEIISLTAPIEYRTEGDIILLSEKRPD